MPSRPIKIEEIEKPDKIIDDALNQLDEYVRGVKLPKISSIIAAQLKTAFASSPPDEKGILQPNQVRKQLESVLQSRSISPEVLASGLCQYVTEPDPNKVNEIELAKKINAFVTAEPTKTELMNTLVDIWEMCVKYKTELQALEQKKAELDRLVETVVDIALVEDGPLEEDRAKFDKNAKIVYVLFKGAKDLKAGDAETFFKKANQAIQEAIEVGKQFIALAREPVPLEREQITILKQETDIRRSLKKVYEYYLYLTQSAQANEEARKKLATAIQDIEKFNEALLSQLDNFFYNSTKAFAQDMRGNFEKLIEVMQERQKHPLTHVQHFGTWERTSSKEKFLQWKAESSPFDVAHAVQKNDVKPALEERKKPTGETENFDLYSISNMRCYIRESQNKREAGVADFISEKLSYRFLFDAFLESKGIYATLEAQGVDVEGDIKNRVKALDPGLDQVAISGFFAGVGLKDPNIVKKLFDEFMDSVKEKLTIKIDPCLTDKPYKGFITSVREMFSSWIEMPHPDLLQEAAFFLEKMQQKGGIFDFDPIKHTQFSVALDIMRHVMGMEDKIILHFSSEQSKATKKQIEAIKADLGSYEIKKMEGKTQKDHVIFAPPTLASSDYANKVADKASEALKKAYEQINRLGSIEELDDPDKEVSLSRSPSLSNANAIELKEIRTKEELSLFSRRRSRS